MPAAEPACEAQRASGHCALLAGPAPPGCRNWRAVAAAGLRGERETRALRLLVCSGGKVCVGPYGSIPPRCRFMFPFSGSSPGIRAGFAEVASEPFGPAGKPREHTVAAWPPVRLQTPWMCRMVTLWRGNLVCNLLEQQQSKIPVCKSANRRKDASPLPAAHLRHRLGFTKTATALLTACFKKVPFTAGCECSVERRVL